MNGQADVVLIDAEWEMKEELPLLEIKTNDAEAAAKKAAEEAEQALYKVKPMIADLERKLQELCNLYTETDKLLPAIDINKVCKGFPKNYYEFTDDQKLRLGALINSTKAMGVLINKRIS